jgi:hypothetical protein
MDAVSVEIRPMNDLPITIGVPLYMPLREKRAEVARLLAAANGLRARLARAYR